MSIGGPSVRASVRELHPWNVTPAEAFAIQRRLRKRLRFPEGRLRVEHVAAADLSATPGDDRLYAVVIVLAWPSLEIVEEHYSTTVASFPYVPGLLSFREIPALLPLFRRLASRPDLVVCDGAGIAHPRGFGLASHLGLLLATPAIGCAKSRLVGAHREPGTRRGARAALFVDGEQRGAVLRTRAGVKPLFVSPGHGVSIREALRWTLLLAPRFRLPEPTRRAHILVNRYRTARASRPPDLSDKIPRATS